MTSPDSTPTPSLSESHHPRSYKQNTYVYPVLSRRSKGISVGVNLNPDKACNFDCIYCQVDRTKIPPTEFVGMDQLRAELTSILTGLQPGGVLWEDPAFSSIPESKRRVADIAFSGDGEPTTFKNFDDVMQLAIEVKQATGFSALNMVIITNATGLVRPAVQRGLQLLDAHQGEIWAKLDAGTPEYFKLIDRTDFPFERILQQITDCAQTRPIVIQSCFMRIQGVGPSEAEVHAYAKRLFDINAAGGQIRLVQVYTVARNPAYSIVSSLADADVDGIAQVVRETTGLETEAYYGSVDEGAGIMGEAPDA